MLLLSWYTGGQLFGMDILHCREVVRAQKVTPVPKSRPCIDGIVNIRGEIVTIINMRVLFGHSPDSFGEDSVFVRLKDPSHNMAVRAERIEEVLSTTQSAFHEKPVQFTDTEAVYISEVLEFQSNALIVLDWKSIIAGAAGGKENL